MYNASFFQPLEFVADKKQGDIVALHSVPGCGAADCPECSRDLPQICQLGHHSGIGQDGYYAPYATIDIRGLVLVPEGVTPAEAAVATDAVNTAYHAIHRRAEVKPHETVFLFGLGGLGFNALQVIRNIGARVIVSDIRQQRLDEAIKLGIPAEDIVPVGKSPVEFVDEKDIYIDTVADFVGAHQTFQDAQHIGMSLSPLVEPVLTPSSASRRQDLMCREHWGQRCSESTHRHPQEINFHLHIWRPGV
jgi:alcohol dehydrogenase, propanol-preferring